MIGFFRLRARSLLSHNPWCRRISSPARDITTGGILKPPSFFFWCFFFLSGSSWQFRWVVKEITRSPRVARAYRCKNYFTRGHIKVQQLRLPRCHGKLVSVFTCVRRGRKTAMKCMRWRSLALIDYEVAISRGPTNRDANVCLRQRTERVFLRERYLHHNAGRDLPKGRLSEGEGARC